MQALATPQVPPTPPKKKEISIVFWSVWCDRDREKFQYIV